VKVLFLSSDFVYPADRGLRVRCLSQLRVLASLPEVQRIHLLAFSEDPVVVDRLRGLEREVPRVVAEGAVVQPVHMRRSPRHLPRLLRLRAQGVPYLIAKFDSAQMHERLASLLRREPFDVVYLGYLGVAAYLPQVRRLAPAARVVLEEHNVEWEIFERLAKGVRLPMRVVVSVEARALRAFERRTLRAVDGTIAISEADASALRDLSGAQVTAVPTYVEPGPERVEATAAPSIAYTGLLGWQPNAKGLDWFCRGVWPIVRSRRPDATLTIAGPGLRRLPDGRLDVPAAWSIEGVRTVGYVPDLEDLYRSNVAMVAPVIGGSGVRMKLLESMRAGMPTVTTTDGAAGLDVADGREMLISDTAEGFAARVVETLADAALRARVRRAAYDYLRSHHSLAAAAAKLAPVLSSR
jgi:glycosyltransferase involved in cell wall biosynthesis